MNDNNDRKFYTEQWNMAHTTLTKLETEKDALLVELAERIIQHEIKKAPDTSITKN